MYFFFKSLLKQVEFIFVNKKNLDKYNRQNLENKIKKLCIFIIDVDLSGVSGGRRARCRPPFCSCFLFAPVSLWWSLVWALSW